MKYKIGYIFTIKNNYTEIAKYCNDNNLIIQEIEKNPNGERQFQIQQNLKTNKEEEIKNEISLLKLKLAEYDYIGVKIAMGVATKEEYADKIAYTETIRKKIRELEEQI